MVMLLQSFTSTDATTRQRTHATTHDANDERRRRAATDAFRTAAQR
jgi:hypothetical protein